MRFYRYLAVFVAFVGFSLTCNVVAAPSKSVSPLFWSLQYQGITSYAFGSIHLGEKAMYPLPDHVMAGFNASDALAVEVNLADISQPMMTQLTMRYGIDGKKPLKQWLDASTQKLYIQYCEQHSLPCDRFRTFKPWLVSVTLMSISFMQSGFDPQMGIDKFFIKQAGSKKPVIALETIDQQLGLLSNLSVKVQQELLVQSMQSELSDLRKLVDSWYKGDEDRLIAMFSKISDAELEQVFHQQMLVQRNVAMVDNLMVQLKSGKSVFTVVGTAHFVGEANMLDLLSKQGVKITRLQPSP